MPHDFIFFTEDHAKKPIALLTPLSDEERTSRRKATGWRTKATVPMPLWEKDSKTDKQGSFIMRNFIGGEVSPDELVSDPNAMLAILEPGLVVADFRPAYFQTEIFQKRAQAQAERERKEQARSEAINLQEVRNDPQVLYRYYRMIVAMVGVDPTKLAEMPQDLLLDIAHGAILTKKLPIPELDEWLLFQQNMTMGEKKPFELMNFETIGQARDYNMRLASNAGYKAEVILGNRLQGRLKKAS